MTAVADLADSVGTVAACAALGVSRAAVYRKRSPVEPKPQPRPASPRALNAEERQAVLDALHSTPLADKAPAEAYATLLDEGKYHCSISTMYRILNANKEVRERRDQLRHPTHAKPQLKATTPNQVWSWDITKLLGPKKWIYFHLYVVIDIYSRYVVGWMLAHRECQHLAERLLRETAIKEQIRPDQLTIHADRGAAMTSRPVSQLMASLGVSRSHSRPHTSNDNPYSESQFKTLKNHPDFLDRFESFDHALDCGRRLIDWYNNHHRRINLGLLTPAAVHTGAAERILDQRRVSLKRPTPCIRNDSSAVCRSPQALRPKSGSTHRRTWRSHARFSSRTTLIPSRRCLKVIDTFRTLPIHGIRVTFRPGTPVKRAHLEPGGLPLEIDSSAAGPVVTVPRLDVHALVIAELAD